MHYFKKNNSTLNADPIKVGTAVQTVKGVFLEYFNESSIHGFKYIGEQKRSTLERIIWLCALIFSILTCCYLIRIIWEKRNSNPVIVSFNEKITPVWEIPFPSVTICPQTKTHTKIFNITKIYQKTHEDKNLTKEEELFLEAISQTCLPNNFGYFEGHDTVDTIDLIDPMLEAAPGIEETVPGCIWKNEFLDLSSSFVAVLTEEGICFTFNSLRHYRDDWRNVYGFEYDTDNNTNIDWDLEHGYRKEADQNTFPKRVLGAGNQESLTIYLADKKRDEDQLCRDTEQGFKVVVHTPGEQPQVSKNFINIPHEQQVSLTIHPKIVTTSEELRHYPPKRRQCYYQNERYLRYFTVYNQVNCEVECLANQTLAICGCVKFSMPRNESHPVCGYKMMPCLNEVQSNSSTMKFLQEMHPSNQSENGWSSCNCLPTCFGIEYKAELEHQIAFNINKAGLPFGTKFSRSVRVTKITINFKEDVFIGLKRSELYSTTDFIANCGGLLGLCMGISILSLVEVLYFITIRLWTNLGKRRRIQQSLNKGV